MTDDRYPRCVTRGNELRLVAIGLLGRLLQPLDQGLRARAGRAVQVLQKGNIVSDIKTYPDLDAWRGAMDLSEGIYKLTRVFPDTERYGLVSQMRRSSVSIPSNIAEGQARGTVAFGLCFLQVAIGSAAEVDTQLELARRLRSVASEATREIDKQLERVRQMLYGMRREHERRVATASVKVGSVLLLVLAATRLLG